MSETILDRILRDKRDEVRARSARTPLNELRVRAREATPPRPFATPLRDCNDAGRVAVIAEIKKASPSKGVIRERFDPPEIARRYAAGGATCLSVLTDEAYFQGHDRYLQEVKATVDLPVLRKDFVVDPYQIYEARVLGADCVLLIASALTTSQLAEFHELARNLGLDALIEVHDAKETAHAVTLDPGMIGINNRNLRTFETRLDTTIELAGHIPDSILIVSESGIHTAADIERLRARRAGAFLIGEAFMRADDPGAALADLLASTAPARAPR